jgi:hypothetical protein
MPESRVATLTFLVAAPRTEPHEEPQMAVHLYAQNPGRRAAQVTADVLVVLWVWAWVRVGLAVRDATLALAGPGRQLEAGADDVAGSLRRAGDSAGDLPLLGDQLRAPFLSAGDAAGAIADAGRRQAELVTGLAGLLGLAVAAVPVLLALALWLPVRVRFVRRATAAQRFIDSDADLRLFALRAMANQPMHRLARVTADPVAAWRADDRQVVRALAMLELADAGLRPPPEPPAPSRLAGSRP